MNSFSYQLKKLDGLRDIQIRFVYKINDNSFKEPIKIKKYITEENDIKVIIGENIYLKSPDIITENVTAKLVSNRIRE